MSSDWLEDLKPLNRLAKAFSRNRLFIIIVLDVFMNLVLTARRK
jgi:hypothetical protein